NKEWKDAAAKFQQLLKLEPNNSDARYSLALALEKQGDKKGAIRELERVLELNPGKEEVVQKLEELKKK
ncbi:MAG: tetratricopeptide repeat protein, partial [bacterium]|nr:tetratricopeptide repeat protein [bacterium]